MQDSAHEFEVPSNLIAMREDIYHLFHKHAFGIDVDVSNSPCYTGSWIRTTDSDCMSSHSEGSSPTDLYLRQRRGSKDKVTKISRCGGA